MFHYCVLVILKWLQPFITDSDASNADMGTGLSQMDAERVEHLVATYASRISTCAKQSYCITS